MAFLVCLVHVGHILVLLHCLVLVPSLLSLPSASFPFYRLALWRLRLLFLSASGDLLMFC